MFGSYRKQDRREITLARGVDISAKRDPPRNSCPLKSSVLPNLSYHAVYLDSAGAGGFLIFPQVKQQFTETLLARTTGTANRALARDINQLGNAFPASATGGGVLAVGQELFSLGAGLSAVLVSLIVV